MAGFRTENFVLFCMCQLTIFVNSETTVAIDTTQSNDGTSAATGQSITSSSNGVPEYVTDTTNNPVSVSNCSLDYPSEAVEQFKELLDKPEEAIFVYVKLNFSVGFESGMAYLSENTTDVIDPLTWVWSKGGRGELLLSSPFDFIHLSLGTMKPGVYSLILDLTADTGCFSNDIHVSDDEKMQSIAATLLDLTAKAALELDKEPIACRDLEEEDDNEQTSVCLEKQLGPDQFDIVGVYAVPSVSYTILQGSTVYECWTASGKTPKSTPVSTQSWLHWLLAAGILLALFSPLALDFFIRKEPPFKDCQNVNERFMLVTDPIPVGFKYVMFFWKDTIPWFHFFRWVLLIFLFGFIQYIPLVVAFCMDRDGLAKRIAAVYRVGLVNQIADVGWHVFINLIYFVFALILLRVYVSEKGHAFLVPFLRERDLQNEEVDEQQIGKDSTANNNAGDDDQTNGHLDAENGGHTNTHHEKPKDHNLAYKHFVVLETPESLWTPDTVLPNARAFLYIMAYRVKMMFDPNLWKFCVKWLWRTITSSCGAPNSTRPILCGVLFVIIFPVYIIVFVFLLCFNSLPLLYCPTRAFQTVSNEVRISEILFFVFVLLIAVIWFCKFVGIFTYIAEIIGYTFVGFVANAEIVGPICLVVVVFIGYFISATTDFYDVYCKLFRELVESAEDVDKELEELVKDAANLNVTANNLKVGVLYRKNLKPARSYSWVKGPKDVEGGEHIEMSDAPEQSATPGASKTHPTETPPNSLAGSITEQPNCNLLSEEEIKDEEILHLVTKPGFGTLVTYNKKGTPAIESKLFWMVVEKYCPVRGKAAASLVQLLTLAVIIAFGMTILSIVDGFRDLPATVEFFGSVVVAGIVPIFLVAMKSPESQECYDEATKRQLRVDVRSYTLFGKLESAAL